jgi:Tol biopolymer transport system component
VHYENGNAEIYFIDADGSDLHQITNGADPYLGMIDWSESKIAFLRDLGTYGKWGEEAKISYIELGEPGYPIFDISPVIQIPGTEWTVRQYNGLNWSPNGQWIVLHMPGEGGIASSDGSIFINENFGNARWKNDSTLVIMPSLSGIEYFNPNNNDSGYIEPVGGYVAVFSPNDQYIIYCNDDAIMRMKSDGTENTVIAQGKGADPVWNTIGNKLAYISWEFADGGFDRSTGIRIINADGSEQIQVVTGFALSPRWQP